MQVTSYDRCTSSEEQLFIHTYACLYHHPLPSPLTPPPSLPTTHQHGLVLVDLAPAPDPEGDEEVLPRDQKAGVVVAGVVVTARGRVRHLRPLQLVQSPVCLPAMKASFHLEMLLPRLDLSTPIIHVHV